MRIGERNYRQEKKNYLSMPILDTEMKRKLKVHIFRCVCHSLSVSDTNSPNFNASTILNASIKHYHEVGIGSFHGLLLQQAFASVMLDAYTDWSN